jgi:outer membrane protein OmpA-like peptidoglycan-associated protein
MRTNTVLMSLIILGFLLGAFVSGSLPAQERGPFTDLRGRNYTDEELGRALFPEAQSDTLTRGVRPAGPQSTPSSTPSSTPASNPSVAINVLFDFNSDKIQQNNSSDLDKLGRILTTPQYSAYRVQIAGYTDSIGSDSYNQRLSERRADSVKRYLLQHFRIQSDRLVVRGYGKSNPIASNDTAEGRDKNRRVEIGNLGIN